MIFDDVHEAFMMVPHHPTQSKYLVMSVKYKYEILDHLVLIAIKVCLEDGALLQLLVSAEVSLLADTIFRTTKWNATSDDGYG